MNKTSVKFYTVRSHWSLSQFDLTFFQYFEWWNGYQWDNNANECWILAIWRSGWKWNGSLSWKGKGGLFWEFIFLSLIDHKTVCKIVSCKVQNNFELVFGHSKVSSRILTVNLFLPWTAERGCVLNSWHCQHKHTLGCSKEYNQSVLIRNAAKSH